MIASSSIFFGCFIIILCLICINLTESCNEDVCGSIVSKCTLTESCICAPKDVSCYKDCVMCMGRKYFEECCSCVGLCPKSNHMKTLLSKKSHVEDFEGVPELFDILVSSAANELEYSWNVFKFPVDFETVLSNKQKSNQIFNKPVKGDDKILTVICTVVYFDNCVSWNKCRQSCRSIGSSSYRWFHDGCCECVDATCINYGVNESHCKFCPEEEDEEDEDFIGLEEYDSYEFESFDDNLKDNTV